MARYTTKKQGTGYSPLPRFSLCSNSLFCYLNIPFIAFNANKIGSSPISVGKK